MSEKIVPFTLEHLDACAHLFVCVSNQEPWNEKWTFETARSRLLETLKTPGFIGFVMLKNELLGFLIGYCEQWDEAKHFYLKEICVEPDKQRKGIGTQLLKHLEKVLAPMNVNLIYLLTIKDGQAEAFYIKNGYQRNTRIILMSK